MTTYEEARRKAQARVAREEKRRRARKRRLIACLCWFLIGCTVAAVPLNISHKHKAEAWQAEKESYELKLLTKTNELYNLAQLYKTSEQYLQQRADVLTFKVEADIPYDVQLAAHVAGDAYGIDPLFLEAVAWKESRYKKDVTSADGTCIGLMQINPKWHAGRAEALGYTVDDLWEVWPSMMTGADYLLELFNTHDDPHWVLMKYNGDSRADGYLAGSQEMSNYAREVMAKYQELCERRGGDDL